MKSGGLRIKVIDMNVQKALLQGINILKNANIEAPALEAGVLLCHVLKCDRALLYAHGEDILDAAKMESYREMVEKRAKKYPLQYITGHQEFMSLDFKVTPDVLIPRQDTETLVEWAIRRAKEKLSSLAGNTEEKVGLRILDIGTGSGCIAVSLAYYVEACSVTSVDISAKALEIACFNAKAAGVEEKITFIQGDLFSPLDMQERFDIILSNPPYIPTLDIAGLQTEVRDYEPLSALNGGVEGMDFYKGIVAGARSFLISGGLLAFEVGIHQAPMVASLMQEDYSGIQIIADLAGIERVVAGTIDPSIFSSKPTIIPHFK